MHFLKTIWKIANVGRQHIYTIYFTLILSTNFWNVNIIGDFLFFYHFRSTSGPPSIYYWSTSGPLVVYLKFTDITLYRYYHFNPFLPKWPFYSRLVFWLKNCQKNNNNNNNNQQHFSEVKLSALSDSEVRILKFPLENFFRQFFRQKTN